MKKYCLLLLTGAMIASCSTESLDRTIFIPDENDFRLPAYSEWGYNSFGAQYERDYFVASRLVFPCKILYSSGMLHFSLNGYISSNKAMTLLFSFPMAQMGSFKDLVQLHDMEIDLCADDCTVKIFMDNNETILDIVKGSIHFKRAQLLTVDNKVNRVILSGVFDLQFWQNIFPTTISNGRFDLGIDQKVFYTN
jgi:hypothetical protein